MINKINLQTGFSKYQRRQKFSIRSRIQWPIQLSESDFLVYLFQNAHTVSSMFSHHKNIYP